jgi:hypothetical protein
MGIQRTRKQKENVHHNFVLSWNPSQLPIGVKGQKNIGHEAKMSTGKMAKNADLLAQEALSNPTKHNIIKSLIIISLILCLELVIYSLWNVRG